MLLMSKFNFFDLIRKIEPKKTPRSVKNFGLFLESKIYYRKYKELISQLKLVAVTGTDGKTTTSTMIYEILRDRGLKTGLISTISAKIGNDDLDTGFHVTTPSPRELFQYLAMMRKRGIEVVVLEVTAHAIAQGRINGLKFDTVVYTNITRNEHLDYFKTYKRYLGTKAKLISKKYLKKGGNVILNRDDESYKHLVECTKKRDVQVYFYGMSEADKAKLESNIYPEFNIFISGDVSEARFSKTPMVKMKVLGTYNVYNSLAAACVGFTFKIPDQQIAETLNNFQTPEGRMNILQSHPFFAIVDFAHTPNALMQALMSAKNLVKKNGKLICIFGCASERDVSKRPIMGAIADQYADVILLVPEDPRNEDVEKINKEIKGKLKSKKFKCFNEMDVNSRRTAIRYAMTRLAQPGDVVIALGKGHEKTINFYGEEFPWNDSDEIKKYIKI